MLPLREKDAMSDLPAGSGVKPKPSIKRVAVQAGGRLAQGLVF